MERKELEQCLSDIQEIQAGLYQKAEKIESQAIESKVNTEVCLNEIRGITAELDILRSKLLTGESKERFEQLVLKLEATVFLSERNTVSLSSAIKGLPARIGTDVRVRFEGRNKTIFLVLAGSVLTASLFIGLWVASWQRNRQLSESDLKYRYLSQQIPSVTFQVDTLYKHNPGQFKKTLETMEYYQKRQQQAEKIAKEKEREAKAAQIENEKIKQKKLN